MPKKKTDTSGMKDMFAMAELDSCYEYRKKINEAINKVTKEIQSLEADLNENRNDIESRNDHNTALSELRGYEKSLDDINAKIQELKNTYNL